MTIENNWYNLVENHLWLYGSENREDFIKLYDGNKMYAVESGKENANYYEIDKSSKNNVEKIEKWQKNVEAKIGMLYLSDLFYTYKVNPISDESYKMTWLDSQINMPFYVMTYASTWNGGHYGIWNVSHDMVPYSYSIGASAAVRPVFYLVNTINITGLGTLDNPYIINLNNGQF